ncbi:MAG: exo-alpha-sialidase [Thermoplasmatota archaeon]
MRTPLAALILVASFAAGCLGAGNVTPSSLPPVAHAITSAIPTFTTERVDPGGWEPGIAAGPKGMVWVSTGAAGGPEVVYSSSDGGLTWQKTPTNPPVTAPSADNDIIVSPTGRVLSSVINGSGPSLDIHYTDDGGKTWGWSQGNWAADQDREWLAVGPKDPKTGQNDVYMLWHNLFSGTADHEMFVSTSRDNGATFGPPIPVTLPGSEAWSDLQCADSGGPSAVFTNASSGQVYALWGTRSSAAGGCGASVQGQFEINVVASTRVWMATSTDQGLTWKDSLVVDDNAQGNIVGMQDQSGAIDTHGNVYVLYTESPKAYPNYEGDAIKYRWAPPDLSHWSAPVTVAAGVGGGSVAGAGNILPYIVAGDPGKLAAFYLQGSGNGTKSLWFPMVAETYDGFDASPNFTTREVSNIPSWQGTTSALMGVCNILPGGSTTDPINSALRGFTCGRSSDVYSRTLGPDCSPLFVWYSNSPGSKTTSGTYVTEQTGGPRLCTVANGTAPATVT